MNDEINDGLRLFFIAVVSILIVMIFACTGCASFNEDKTLGHEPLKPMHTPGGSPCAKGQVMVIVRARSSRTISRSGQLRPGDRVYCNDRNQLTRGF